MGYCLRTVLSSQAVSPELVFQNIGTESIRARDKLVNTCLLPLRAYATVDQNPINTLLSGRLEASNETMNLCTYLLNIHRLDPSPEE
ncbi:hypothetical protein Y032_0211g2166 [Ancylostoma ceylanicum]|uniref:Uncharacterized protein n=1 Tax=Ancylostoma ceylanicum TaxID=53326 RepID=A0A016SJT7_9BILA|nr:hypothetical protein Y032_0211g2166 [Ancylostoma ceylanicum]